MNYTYLKMPVVEESIREINYSQSNVGNNPTINLATGRVQYVFPDVELGAGNYAVNVAHVYNSKLNKLFADKIIGLGKNWKLNLSQFVISDNYDSASGQSVLKYLDESGEIHRYVAYDTNKWHNDCKATSIIEKVNGEYVLSDGVGNKLYFNANGYLIKSVSCQKSDMVKKYNYDASDRLVSVYDQRTPQNHIEFVYNSDKLERIIAYSKHSRPITGVRYEYDSDNLIAAYQIAYGANSQQIAEKQILEVCYENGNLMMIIDPETKAASLLQYDTSLKATKLSTGFVKENCIESGMKDSADKSLALCDQLQSGWSCEPSFIEKSYNTYKYMYNSADDKIAVATEVTNECDITLRYYIDRKASVTSSFEVDKRFSKNGENLKTLTKFEGQENTANNTSELGYINGCDIFSTKNRTFNPALFPFSIVNGKPVKVNTNFNYSFWLKTKKNYDLLEVKATYKTSDTTAEQFSTKAIHVNSQAMGAWQRVVIPISMAQNCIYSLNVSFWNNKRKCNDDFEICCIGAAPSPSAELMLPVSGSIYLPLSAAQQVKITLNSGSVETIEVGKDFFLTESDIISTFGNKRTKNTFDLIYCNGTKRRSNLTDIQFSFPQIGWSNYKGTKPFYIHTALPVKDANIKTYYVYESDGFTIRNDYTKAIDGTTYNSSTYVKMDYIGNTIYEKDEYGTRKDYQYYSDGSLKQLTVSNGSDIQSLQKYEYKEGRLVSVDDGLNKQQIIYNEQSQVKKIKDLSCQDGGMLDAEHSVTNSIGIFQDKSVCVSEYNEKEQIGSIHTTYENGDIRTISDGLVKYGVKHNFLKDCVTYTQFEGNVEKPIQLDAVSEYSKVGDKYYRTHTSKFYDATGKIIDASSVEVDAYGKPIELSKGKSGSYQYDSNNTREKYRYAYPEIQESEFTNKPISCTNFHDYSTTQYKYDNDGNLIGWKEEELSKPIFEVQQIAPTTTKYVFGKNDQEYFVQINHDKNKMASPQIESVIIQEDTRDDVDKPKGMFQVDYKWLYSKNLSESKTTLSVEKYSYLNLHNNRMLQKTEYNSSHTVSSVTWRTEASDNLSYYDNGLVKQETITHQNIRVVGLLSNRFDPITSVRTYQYDNLRRITKEINSGLNVTRTYSYYPDGRLQKISGFRDDDVRNFVYDSKGRLVSINSSTTFAYDHFGNRISKTVNGVTSTYTYDVGGRLISAGGVKYDYNADGIRCKKTCIANGIGERMYLDGGKILGEDRANYKMRYFYDATGLKRIRKIKGGTNYDYECVKDSQGSIIMLISTHSGAEVCRYEYDALGKCTILHKDNEIGDENPFRWKGFFYDSESGFYYANGSYYDPETGMYVDAAPVSSVIENADSPRYIDRNGVMCYNSLALVSSPYTAITTVEMSQDPSYDPGQTWWEKIWGHITSWWQSVPTNVKTGIGIALIIVSVTLAFLPGGQAGSAFLKSALVQLAIGVGVTTVGWAIGSAMSGEWNANALCDSLAETLFFAGAFLFVESSISAIKYACRVQKFTKWLNKGEANNTVYKGINAKGEEVYTGITKQPINNRLRQHQRAGKPFVDLKPNYTGLTRNQARAIETYKILHDGTSQVNQILSISKKHRFFNDAMEWAEMFLGG